VVPCKGKRERENILRLGGLDVGRDWFPDGETTVVNWSEYPTYEGLDDCNGMALVVGVA